jgi:threonine dehydratase
MGLDREQVRQARTRLSGVIHATPLERSGWLSATAGREVFLKLECWQRTRSFKARGAVNALASLGGAASAGVIAASAGNHGLGVAYAAAALGVPATIFVPAGAPAIKRERIVALGAELRLVPGSYDEAERAAQAYAATVEAHFIHAFTDPAVIAGQGTVGLEILEALPDVERIVAPAGGGGLLAGLGAATRGTAVRLTGVQSEATPALYEAFRAGRVVAVPVVDTLADGLAGQVEDATYALCRAWVDEILLVSEVAIAAALRELYRREAVVAEGSAAVVVAALLAGLIPGSGPVVLVISGGNIDGARLARILGG